MKSTDRVCFRNKDGMYLAYGQMVPNDQFRYFWTKDQLRALTYARRTAHDHLRIVTMDNRDGRYWTALERILRHERPMIYEAPHCPCCGKSTYGDDLQLFNGAIRCKRHVGRNPCVVDGCTRTGLGQYPSNHSTVCGTHWKRYVPPGSPERRALNRLAHIAKRLGYSRKQQWPDELERRWWVLWAGILRRVRQRSTAGHLDMTEINKMMGWD